MCPFTRLEPNASSRLEPNASSNNHPFFCGEIAGKFQMFSSEFCLHLYYILSVYRKSKAADYVADLPRHLYCRLPYLETYLSIKSLQR